VLLLQTVSFQVITPASHSANSGEQYFQYTPQLSH
jgi:hypothetical protein